ncbi:PREDICTED: GPI transamidase, partial [Prunus dulcis]
SRPFDLGLTWKLPVVWSCQKAPLHASRFLMGSRNERGAIVISLRSTEVQIGSQSLFSTLRVFVNEQPQEVSDIVEKMRVSPSVNKMSRGVMEMVLKFPRAMKLATITLEFDKGFLHIDEYPPDANQGFDIPSAIISFPNFHTSMQFFKDKSVEKSSTLSKFQ